MKFRKSAAVAVAGAVLGAAVTIAPTPAYAASFDLVGSVAVHGRVINLWKKTSDGVGLHGQINGAPGDQVWLVNAWGQNIGRFTIPQGATQANTNSVGSSGSQFAACGKAGDRPDVACTPYRRA